MTTRDPNAIIQRIWSATGDVATPASLGLTIEDGYIADYSTPGGREPERELSNWHLRAMFSLAVEVNQHNLLVWDAIINYVHPALVFGSDFKVYVSGMDSVGVDPVGDTTGAWTEFAAAEGEVFSPALETKLGGIEDNATADQTRDEIIALIGTGTDLTNAQVKAAYEANTNTNAFTDALLTALQAAAPLDAPAFTGNPTFSGIPIFNSGFTSTGDSVVPTQSAGNSSTKAANTAFVNDYTEPVVVHTTQASYNARPMSDNKIHMLFIP